MPTGRIKYYNPDKGFGFIAQDNGEADVFLHVSAINWVDDELGAGQRVKYDITEGKRGLVARNVEVLLTQLEQKWLRQGKAIIPRDYPRFTSREQSKTYDEGKSNLSQEPIRPVSVVSSNSQTSEQSVELPPSRPDVEPHDFEPTEEDNPNQKLVASAAQSESSLKKPEHVTFGNLYIQKQIRLQTSMIFGFYNHEQRPVTIREFTQYTFTLQAEEENQEIPKTDVKYCYKVEDAESVQSLMRYDEQIRSQELKPIMSRKKRYQIDTLEIQLACKEEYPIEVIMHEGEIFRGMVDWVSPSEIKMVLENGSKVVVFRHAICEFKAVPSEKETNV